MNISKTIDALVSAKKIVDLYAANNKIKSFVIGKTESIEDRQQDERYKGYKLYQITEDDYDTINSLEKVLILVFGISDTHNKLHDCQNLGGQGNDKATKPYVAIKTV